ncbi:hypothetical protein BGW37DRAFT_485396 [Umbelopsis sp. PMI_123]|nr:hypothetical protein BGW37DRAFT_485396 [Umbelopsis sp. PMI_123]
MLPENNESGGKRKNLSGITRPDLQRSVPTFLSKLYNMVNDPASTDLIRWSNDGTSFIVERHEEFAAKVLPRFFKHNTFASFVRQLNMYDFHKVPHIMQGVMVSENEGEVWEFSNSNFQRDQPDLLLLVSRKRTRDRDDKDPSSSELSQLINDIASIKRHQTTISTDLRNLQRDNLILWQDNLAAREKHERHQDMIQKVLQFLATVFSSNQLEAYSKQKDFILENRRESDSPLQTMFKPRVSSSSEVQSPPWSVNQEAININLPSLIQSAKGTTGGESSTASPSASTSTPLTTVSVVAAALGSTPFGPSPAPVTRPPSESSYTGPSQRQRSPSATDATKESEPQASNNIDISQQSSDLAAVAKSAESINDDIDSLQGHIENLATQLGFDPINFGEDIENADITMFMDQHDNMINSASYNDRLSLMDMIGSASMVDAGQRSASIQDNSPQTPATNINNSSSKQEDRTPPAIGAALKLPLTPQPLPSSALYPWPPHFPPSSLPPAPSEPNSGPNTSEVYPVPNTVMASPFGSPHHSSISPLLHQTQSFRSGPQVPTPVPVPGMYDPATPVVPGVAPPGPTPSAGYPGYPYMGQPIFPGMYYAVPPTMTPPPHLPSTTATGATPPIVPGPPSLPATAGDDSEPAIKKLRTDSPLASTPTAVSTPPHPAMPLGLPPYHPAYAHMAPHMMYGQLPTSAAMYPFYASAFPHGYGYPHPPPAVTGYLGMTTPVPVASQEGAATSISKAAAAPQPNVQGSEAE